MSVFIVTGPSGSGKTSLMRKLAERNNQLFEGVSHTTRDMRAGEVEGKDYYFISTTDFNEINKEGRFVETATYGGNQYGLTAEQIDFAYNKDNRLNSYVIVEYDGYKQIKERYPEAISIFIQMSKEDCLANMLIRKDPIDKALNRSSLYDDEVEAKIDYDYVIKNIRGKQGEVINILSSIVDAHASKVPVNQ